MAVICGVVIFLPQWRLIRDAGPAYSGIIMAEVDNDHYYLSRIAAAYRGDWKITQASIQGSSDAPYASPPLGENTVAVLAHLFGFTPGKMQLAGYFLFPFVLGLLVYSLAWKVSGSKLVGALAPLGIILGSSIVMDFHQLKYLFTDPSRLWINPYNRPIHPQVSSIYFFAWLGLFYAYLIRPNKIKLAAAGALLGLLFYVYPYSWTVAATLAGLYIVASFLRKNFAQAKALLLMLAGGSVISAGYWWNVWQLGQNSLFELLKQHFVIYSSREFLWSTLLFVDFLALALFFWRKPKDEKFRFFLLMFLSLAIVINQQLITGIKMFPGHWHWYYIVPFSIFFFTHALFALLKPVILRRSIGVLAAVFLVTFGLFAQQAYYDRYKESVISYQRFGPVYEWLGQNVAKGEVVVAEDKFSERLPIYTPLLHYTWQGADELYLITNERIKHGFFVKLYLQGVKDENLDKYIHAGTAELQILLSLYYRRYAQACDVCYTQEAIEGLKREYREFLQKDFEAELKQYKINYAVWDPVGQFQNFDQFDFMQQVSEINGLKIYRVN